jgi:chemotaxis response regulator CheB
VFGMPKEAIAAGGVERIVPLEVVASAMLAFASGAKDTAKAS